MIVSRRFVKALLGGREKGLSREVWLGPQRIETGRTAKRDEREDDQSLRTNSRVLPMTVRLESSMATAATNGVSSPLMATGMAIRL